MNCPNCRTANPEEARFCFNCGTPLSQRCANCQSDLAPGARFCSNCGQPVNVQTAADSARLTRLAAAAPAPLADKIRAAHLTGERKIVTCLFADVVGSTSLAERMDPDDWTEIMNRAFDQLSPAIYRYEGTIARLMGDAILAFFGAPVAHEDDPVRAAHAALDLIVAAQSYAGQVRKQYGIEFAIRVGLNTGPVVVGNVGSDLKYEYTAMGDAVNLAARMQSAAKTMTALISEHTYRYIAPVFDCADLGPIEIKGKSEPVRVYEVIAPKAAPDQIRGLETAGLESRMIGREAELAALLGVSQAVGAGLGRAVVITGEAGLGKSRLISEWKAATEKSQAPSPKSQAPSSKSQAPNPNFQWAEGHCLSYGQGLAYHLLIDLLHSLIGVAATADEPTTHAALKTVTAELFGEGRGEAYSFLGHLLSLELESSALERVQALDPQALQSGYADALSQLLTALAAHRPLALLLDDIHWADSASVELLLKLLPLISAQPILFCFITRPDRDAPGWKLVSAARDLGNALTGIDLHPLSEADSRQLVSNLLEVEALPERARDLILRKAEGNPFFVEEMIRMLIDRGLIVRRGDGWAATAEIESVGDIPDNVQGLLLARIDRLVDEAKRTLRVASVIGRQFSVRVLEQVVALAQYLSTLEASDLIRLAATQPELEYLFRHALIQEAAYSSLVKQDRRQLHLAVGEALERLYPDRLTSREFAPVLAGHFYQAGADARALKYLILAGDAAARIYANVEASLHYARALDIAKRLGAKADQFLHLYSSYGNALELTARHAEALTTYAEMESLAQSRGDKEMEFASVMARAKIHSTPHHWHDAAKAKALLERALTLAHALGDRAAESKILWNLMLLQVFAGGDPAQTAAYGEESLAIARELNLREQMAFTLNDISYAYVLTGETDKNIAALNEARDLWRELGNLPMLSDNLANTSIRQFADGNYDQALASADESFRISESIGNRWGQASSRLAVGQIYSDRGEMEAAIANMTAAVQLSKPLGHSFGLLIQADLGWVYASLGAAERGLVEAEHARQWAISDPTPASRLGPVAALARIHVLAGDLAAARTMIDEGHVIYDPATLLLFAHYVLALAEGELALAEANYDQARQVMEELLAELDRMRMRPFVPDALYLKSQALLAQGQTAEAREVLQAALAGAQALNARRMLWPILWSLSEIEATLGNGEQAEDLKRQVREVIAYIADHCPPDLRDSFLSLLSVRVVMS